MAKRLRGIPSIQSLASELTFQKRWIPDASEFEKGETRGIDVRLQVHDGSWSLHTGDSSYDQDHRGHWGAGFLTPRCNARELARELIDEAEESAAMAGEFEDPKERSERPIW